MAKVKYIVDLDLNGNKIQNLADGTAATDAVTKQQLDAIIPIDLSSEVTGTLPVNRGGTGLNSLGTAGQLLKVNSGGTGLEYFTPNYLSGTLTTNRVPYWNGTSLADTYMRRNTSNGVTEIVSNSSGEWLRLIDSVSGLPQLYIKNSGKDLLTSEHEIGIFFAYNSGAPGENPVIYGRHTELYFGGKTFFNDAIITENKGDLITGTSAAAYVFNRKSEGSSSDSRIRLYVKRSNTNYNTWTNYIKSTICDITTGTPVNTRHHFLGKIYIASTTINDGIIPSFNVETDGNFGAALGNSTTPAYSFQGDTNTGLFSPGADALAITTGGTERMRVDASGNVGIGITPSVKFHVAGQSRIDGTFSVKGSGSTPFSTGTAAEMRWWNTVTTGQFSFILTDSNFFRLYDSSNNLLSQWNAGGKFSQNVQDNVSAAYVLNILGGATFFQFNSTDNAENLQLGSPTSGAYLSLNGGIQIKNVSTKTATYTATKSDTVIDADCSTGAFTINLDANPGLGQLIFISKIDNSANALTVAGNGKNINGSASISLASQYDKVMLIYTGSEWRRMI